MGLFSADFSMGVAMSFSKLILKNFKKEMKKYKFLFCGGAVIGSILILYLYMFEYTSGLSKRGLFPGNIQVLFLFLAVFVVIIGISFFRFLIGNYMKNRIEDYEIYIDLGIPKKKLLKCIFLEYASIFIFMLVAGVLFGLFLIGVVYSFLQYKSMYTMEEGKSVWLVLTFYLLFMLGIFWGSIFLFYLGSKRNGIEKYFKVIIKKNCFQKNGAEQIASFVFGIFLQMITIFLLLHFSVFYMILAMGTHLIGTYFMIHQWISVQTHFLHHSKRRYWKHMLGWRFFSFEYKQNKNIIFILYTIHFFILFIALAIGLSALDSEKVDVKKLYPYESVFIGGSNEMNSLSTILNKKEEDQKIKSIKNKSNQDNLKSFPNIVAYDLYLLNINGKDVYALSEDTYQAFTHRKLDLKTGQMAYVEQITDENITNQEAKAYVDGMVQKHDFNVTSNQNKILFGEDLALNVRDIYVFSNQDTQNFQNASVRLKLLTVKNNYGISTTFILKKQSFKWKESLQNKRFAAVKLKENEIFFFDGSTLRQSYHTENIFVLISAFTIGILLSFISILVLFVKISNDLKSKKEEYKILQELGMPFQKIKKVFSKQIYYCFYVPVYLAAVFGGVFFGIDLYSESDKYLSDVRAYLIMFLSVLFFQIVCGKLTFYQLSKQLDRG